jgi:hypothetical protein
VRRPIQIVLLTAGLLLTPVTAAVSQTYTYKIAGLVGVGGSLDETDAGFGNPTWQLTFTSDIAEKTYFAARVGGIHWSSGEQVAEAFGPSLYYVTVAGEYRETRASFSGGFVEPGVYIGLGFYSLDGTDEDGESLSETAPGLAMGLIGDLPLNGKRNLNLRLELAAHYAALQAAQLFGMVHIGLSYSF